MTKAIRWMAVLMGLAYGSASAYDGIVLSSYTTTNDTTRTIRIGPAEFVGLTVGVSGSAGSLVKIYNSSNTTTTDERFEFDATAVQTHQLNNTFFPIGLTYTTFGAPKVTIRYR